MGKWANGTQRIYDTAEVLGGNPELAVEIALPVVLKPI